MEFRNIVISNPARMSIKHNQLCIVQEREALIPLEDICSVLLESRQIQISAAALERLAVSGITVFFCDEEHLPSAQLVAMNQFSRQHKMLYAQFELPRPIQKQLWKCIVQQKINNQAACLRLSGKNKSTAASRCAISQFSVKRRIPHGAVFRICSHLQWNGFGGNASSESFTACTITRRGAHDGSHRTSI